MPMKWKIDYHCLAELPKLAWVASVDLDRGSLSVFHGEAVECRDEWMVEGVWDGDFESGNFHHSENFFGSGIRIEGPRIYFVPSTALVDRLFSCLCDGTLLVSNSLIQLLALTGAQLDPDHNYRNELTSILGGITNYRKEFAVLHPSITTFCQVYFSNIVLIDKELSYELRGHLHKIDSFQQYHSMLSQTLSQIRRNYESLERQIPMDPFATMSSGYDSTAVTSLVKNIGVTTCFSSKSRTHRFLVGCLVTILLMAADLLPKRCN
jgi:hypothetical protein